MEQHCNNYILDMLTQANINGDCFVDVRQLRDTIVQKYGLEVEGQAFQQYQEEIQSPLVSSDSIS